MSVNLDPKTQPVIKDSNPEPKSQPKLSWFEWWVDSVYEGLKMETTPTKTYCLYKWDSLGGKDLSTKEFEKFMEKCTRDCEALKRFAEWHRRS